MNVVADTTNVVADTLNVVTDTMHVVTDATHVVAVTMDVRLTLILTHVSFLVKVAQQLDLRCVLAPTPWVVGPNHVSNPEYKKFTPHCQVCSISIRRNIYRLVINLIKIRCAYVKDKKLYIILRYGAAMKV